MEPPYLSVVATARNDEHGGNLLRRLQTFVNALAGQARHHAVPVELVLVEWNPPPERPTLREAIRWPEPGPCRIRVVTVPAEIHRRYPHHENLPLFQMIGKNAGIRRAEGEFILATNIDVLFSCEFFELLAARRLESGRLYRMDRHDVDAGVPPAAPVVEQLQYCRTHAIRIHAREGSFALTADDHRGLAVRDIARAAEGVFFETGWYPPEQHFGRLFRWAAPQSEIAVRPAASPRVLLLEVEPAAAAVALRAGATEVRIAGRALLRLLVPAGRCGIRLEASPPARVALDPRTLCFRAFRCRWAAAPAGSECAAIEAARAAPRPFARAGEIVLRGAEFARDVAFGRARFRMGRPPRMSSGGKPGPAALPPDLHLNASGDFTLLDRARWFALRGYPEFAMYSMNLDSLLCYMAHYAGAFECVLRDPIRAYHIEHGAGSGWTPEGERLLFSRLSAAGIPWMEFDEVFRRACEMERLQTVPASNGDDWGLAGEHLPETVLAARA